MIVGIDPGTTVGWAAIDWDGRVIAKGSQREFDRDSLVKRLVQLGTVILVGTDKAKVPSFVQEVATSLGALVISPQEDLKVDEKREMARDARGNAHELDALAAAIFALRKKEVLVRKIRAALERERKMVLFDDVVDLVLRGRVSIKTALDAFEKKDDEIVFDGRDETPIDLVRMIEALARARSDARNEVKKNESLEARAAGLERQVAYLKKQMAGLVRPKTREQVSKVVQSQMMSLEHRFARANAQVKAAEEKMRMFEQAVLSGRFVALPRLRSLSKQSVGVDSSVVFVDDAGKVSDRTLGLLKERGVELLVCGKLPERRLPFAVVESPKVIEGDSLVLVRRDWLEERRRAKEVLVKVVEEYQRGRA